MNTKEAIERVRTRFDKWALDNEDLTALQVLGLVDVESEDNCTAQEQRKMLRKEGGIKMNNDLLKLLQDAKDSTINGYSKISDNPIYEYVLCGIEMSFDRILKIVRFYDDVINSKWIKFSDAYPEDFNLDWVLVQFVEKSGFVGLPYIAEFDKSKNIWRLQGQESDNTIETFYINNDCIPSSWKIIENSPEWSKATIDGESISTENQSLDISSPEWSEEDEDAIRGAIGILLDDNNPNSVFPEHSKLSVGKIVKRLKSLRPQSHWKPSEEQMEAFKKYIEESQARAEAAVGGWNNFDVMIQLYEQLKKHQN